MSLDEWLWLTEDVVPKESDCARNEQPWTRFKAKFDETYESLKNIQCLNDMLACWYRFGK